MPHQSATKNYVDDPFWDSIDEKKSAFGIGSDEETDRSLPKSDDECNWGHAKPSKIPVIKSPPTKLGWFRQSASKWVYGKALDKPFYCKDQEREQSIANEMERADQLRAHGCTLESLEVLNSVQEGELGLISKQGKQAIEQKMLAQCHMDDLIKEISRCVTVTGSFDDNNDSKTGDANLSVDSEDAKLEGDAEDSSAEDEALSLSSNGSAMTVVNPKNMFSANNDTEVDDDEDNDTDEDEDLGETVPTKKRY